MQCHCRGRSSLSLCLYLAFLAVVLSKYTECLINTGLNCSVLGHMVRAFLFWEAGSQLAMVASSNCARHDIEWFPAAHFWKSWGWKLSRKHQKHLISVLATFHAMLVHYHVWVMPRWLEKHSFTCGVNNMASSHMPKIDFRQVACDGLRPPKGTSIAVRCVCYAYMCMRLLCAQEKERSWKPVLSSVICTLHRGRPFLTQSQLTITSICTFSLVPRHLVASQYVYIEAGLLPRPSLHREFYCTPPSLHRWMYSTVIAQP